MERSGFAVTVDAEGETFARLTVSEDNADSVADNGFDPAMFGLAMSALNQITDDAFAQYDVARDQISEMRQRFADWRRQLNS